MSDLMLDVDQAGELKAAFRRGGWTNTEIKKACGRSFLSDVRRVLIGEAKIVPVEKAANIPIDPVVRVDRSVRPVYPVFLDQNYISKPEFIALEKLGPDEFDAGKLRQWLHPQQKKSIVRGDSIHEVLVKKKLIAGCLGYADLLGIQAKGIEFFRRHFRGKAVFGWRSVVPHRGGGLSVPYLVGRGGGVVLDWRWLGHGWDAFSPALRFAI